MGQDISHKNIHWPSGDCTPMLATTLSLEELSKRCALKIFRDQDDLDWFTGAAFEDDELGSVLIMKHDNNPIEISVFYVDSQKDFKKAICALKNLFKLNDGEINWATPFARL